MLISESCLTLPINHQLFSFYSPSPTHSRCLTGNHQWGGDCGDLLPPTCTCWIRATPQCQKRCLKSCLHLPPEKWSLLTFQRELNQRGHLLDSLCFPYVQFHCNCTTCDFVYDIDSHVFFPMAYLQGSLLYSMCVRVCVFKKKKMTTSVYCRCLCQVQLVGLVCLLPFLDRGFYLLCSWSRRPTGNTAF